jgi:hypothetical protein
MRALIVAGFFVLAGCGDAGAPGAQEIQLEMLRAEEATLLRAEGLECDRVIGSDGNLTVCQVGRESRIYRVMGPGAIQRVEPGPA